MRRAPIIVTKPPRININITPIFLARGIWSLPISNTGQQRVRTNMSALSNHDVVAVLTISKGIGGHSSHVQNPKVDAVLIRGVFPICGNRPTLDLVSLERLFVKRILASSSVGLTNTRQCKRDHLRYNNSNEYPGQEPKSMCIEKSSVQNHDTNLC
jgi:hypothetical protein